MDSSSVAPPNVMSARRLNNPLGIYNRMLEVIKVVATHTKKYMKRHRMTPPVLVPVAN